MSEPLYDALEKAVKAVRAHPDLAPTLSISMTQDGMFVSPWMIGAPLTALLSWHDAMHEITRGASVGTGYTTVIVRGILVDTPVTATAVTYQLLPQGAISEADLRRAARQEEPLRA